MKNIRVFLSEKFQFLEVKFSIYLNRRVFVRERVKFFDYTRDTTPNFASLNINYFVDDVRK